MLLPDSASRAHSAHDKNKPVGTSVPQLNRARATLPLGSFLHRVHIGLLTDIEQQAIHATGGQSQMWAFANVVRSAFTSVSS
jgi:hypothetical protein